MGGIGNVSWRDAPYFCTTSCDNFYSRHFLFAFVKLKGTTRLQSANRCLLLQKPGPRHHRVPLNCRGGVNSKTMLQASCHHVPISSINRETVAYVLPVGKAVRPPSSGRTQCIFAKTDLPIIATASPRRLVVDAMRHILLVSIATPQLATHSGFCTSTGTTLRAIAPRCQRRGIIARNAAAHDTGDWRSACLRHSPAWTPIWSAQGCGKKSTPG